MLIPGVACEGTDGLDAIQRAFAYVFGRPVRLILYSLLLLVVGAVMVSIVGMLVNGSIAFADGSLSAWTTRGSEILSGTGATGKELNGFAGAAATIVDFWKSAAGLVVGAFGVSFFFSGSTVLYLVMRRACDGQDVAELWMPGMVEGTMARAMSGRAEAAVEEADAEDPVQSDPTEDDE
jgi:hypothetical protein